MKKYTIQILIASGIVALGLALFFGRGQGTVFVKKNVVEYTNLVHGELFRNATNQYDANVTVSHWRPQEIDGQEVGSSSHIRLEWEEPEQDYNHFVVTATDPVSGFTKSESRSRGGVSVDFANLFPDTKYHFALQACLDRRCEQWLIHNDEVARRTSQTYWQLTDELSTTDVENLTIIENYVRRFTRTRLNLIDEDGVRLGDEEKNQLTLQAVSYLDDKFNQFLELSADKSPVYAKLMNP